LLSNRPERKLQAQLLTTCITFDMSFHCPSLRSPTDRIQSNAAFPFPTGLLDIIKCEHRCTTSGWDTVSAQGRWVDLPPLVPSVFTFSSPDFQGQSRPETKAALTTTGILPDPLSSGWKSRSIAAGRGYGCSNQTAPQFTDGETQAQSEEHSPHASKLHNGACVCSRQSRP
jgi:hypothetical protein